MSELIFEHAARVQDDDGAVYVPRTYGEVREDGTWQGWIEFHPVELDKRILTTGRETSQPNRNALEYWATGLEPIYFEGAFGRAA